MIHISPHPKSGRQPRLYTVCAQKIKYLVTLTTTLLCLVLHLDVTATHASDFPHYQVISDNVLFWEKIYGYYDEDQALIHDSNDLSLVYKVLPLLPNALPAAGKINRKIRKDAVATYQQILIRLSKTHRPRNGEEKRIYNHLGGKGGAERLEKAAQNIRIQTGLKERFSEGVVRSGKYIDEIRAIFASYQLPLDLAYLPHVESSFNNNAYSKSGASGMWQFTRGTGKDYLTINSLIDERSDPIYAADAAARYLRDSYKALGNWPLALTSYNYGRAGMLRAQKAKGSYPAIFASYSEGYFKFASRNFYPEFLAAVKVAKRLERSPRLTKDIPLKSIYFTTKGYVSVASLGRLFKLPERVIAERNPALNKHILLGDKYIPKNYSVRLPSTSLVRNKSKNFPSSAYKSRQKKRNYYYVKNGDTLGAIARRFNISVKDLTNINNLNKSGDIRINQLLRFPIK